MPLLALSPVGDCSSMALPPYISLMIQLTTSLNAFIGGSPSEFVINVKNSILLGGLIDEDLTLYPDTEYLVSNDLATSVNTTLTILPGVKLLVSDDLIRQSWDRADRDMGMDMKPIKVAV